MLVRFVVFPLLIVVLGYGLSVYLSFVSITSETIGPLKNHKGCKHIDNINVVPGAEDFVHFGEYLITGTNDRFLSFEISLPRKTNNGSFYLIDPASNFARLLPLNNFPENVAFHPHGLFLSQFGGISLLYAINHAFAQGGERIDVFKILGRDFDDVSVDYFQTILSPVFPSLNGTLNDLAVVEPGKLFVTQYKPFPAGPEGVNSEDFISKLYAFGNFFDIFATPHWSYIWFCSFDSQQPGTVVADCSKATNRIPDPNGITIDDEGLIYVSFPLKRQVVVYKQDSNLLTPLTTIPSTRSIDNLIFCKQTGKIYGGFFTALPALRMLREGHSKHAKPTENTVSGGCIEITKSGNSFIAKETHFLPGILLSMPSVCTRVGDNMLLGSWYDNGVLKCDAEDKIEN